jgi:hypothetical protein
MKQTKHPGIVLCAVVLCATAGVAMASGRHHSDNAALPNILTFDTMYGVEGPFLGEANAIRGVVGDEAPWEVEHFIKGRLTKEGRLQIVVRGLVFGDDPELVPPDLIGKNDEETFRGLVSCLSEENETVVTRNVETEGFPADENGNSYIDAKIELPNPCIAPIVFVMAGSEEKWFAVTGFESEGESDDSASARHR